MTFRSILGKADGALICTVGRGVLVVSVVVFVFAVPLSGCDMLGLTGEDQSAENPYDPNGDVDLDGILNKDDTDIDGDGLSNEIETDTHHTSPYIADTDGDGWRDDEEINNYVDTYPPKFSPLIADLPALKLRLRSDPEVEMEYFTTTGTEASYSTSEGSSSTSSFTNTNSLTQTTANEYGWSVETGIEFGRTSGHMHVVGHVNVGAHGTYTQEESTSWTNSRTVENTRQVKRARSRATSESLQNRGGRISVSVSFSNLSNIAYTVSDVMLSAYKLDPHEDDFVIPIATLECGSGLNVSLRPQRQDDSRFIFENDSLTVEKVLQLLEGSQGIVFGISGYQITMEDRNFNEANTEVPARTAEVIIDYGPGLENKQVEQYSVATKTDFNREANSSADRFHPVSLATVLERIGVDVTVGTTGSYSGIQAINAIEQDLANQKYWYLVHRSEDNGQDVSTIYSIKECSYDLGEIMVQTGDMVELIYSVDVDNDGVPLRTETMYGSDDEDVDSDDDGLQDGTEISEQYGTNPAAADSDGDGLSDAEDEDPLVPRTTDNTNLQDMVISNDSYELSVREQFALASDDPLPTDLTGHAFPIPYDATDITIDPEVNVMELNLKGDTITDEGRDIPPGTRSEAIPLHPGENPLSLTVTASDGSTKETYDFAVKARVPSLSGFNAQPPTGEHDQIGLSWEFPPEAQMYSGVFVLRNSTDDFSDIPSQTEGLPHDDTLFGYDLVYGPESKASSSDSYTDQGLVSETEYHYRAVLYFKQDNDPTYFLSPPAAANATTTAPPNVRFTVIPYGILTVAEQDSGDSDFTWEIRLEHLDPSNRVVDTRVLSEIPGSASADEKFGQDAQIRDAGNAEQVRMNTGGFTLFDWARGTTCIWVDRIDSFNDSPKATLVDNADDSVPSGSEFEPGGFQFDFTSPRLEDYKFRINVFIQEHDSGPWDVADSDLDFEFRPNDAGEDDDTWVLTTTGDLPTETSASSSSHLSTSDTAMEEDTVYWLNPYFKSSDEGKMQVFFRLKWTSGS